MQRAKYVVEFKDEKVAQFTEEGHSFVALLNKVVQSATWIYNL